MANLSMYLLSATAVTARNAEYDGTPFTDIPGNGSYADNVLGCNKAGSCAPGIGIATDNIEPKLEDWTVNDQGNLDQAVAPAARIAQESQHIGGTGLVAGDPDPTVGSVINAIISPDSSPDINDTVSFIEALAQAATGVGFGAANADPVNRGQVTVEIGERLWGTNAIA